MNRITVLPGDEHRLVPVENLRHVYFDPKEPREVNLTPYIARRLADGDLVPAPGQDMAVEMPDGRTLAEFLKPAATEAAPAAPAPKVSQRAAPAAAQTGDNTNV